MRIYLGRVITLILLWNSMLFAEVLTCTQEFEAALQPTPFSGCKGESLVASNPSGLQVSHLEVPDPFK